MVMNEYILLGFDASHMQVKMSEFVCLSYPADFVLSVLLKVANVFEMLCFHFSVENTSAYSCSSNLDP